MKRFLTIIKREQVLFKNNKVMKTLFFAPPVLLGLIYGLIYKPGQLSNLPIMVIDKDHSSASATLVDMLEDNDLLTVKYVNTENINIRDKFIREGIYAAVLIPNNFEKDLLQKRYTEINTYINNTNMLVSGYVSRGINTVMVTYNAINSAKAGKRDVIKLNLFRLFNTSSNYLLYIWPSFLALFLQSSILIIVAMSFATETEKHSFYELKQFKLPVIAVMVGKLSFYWILSILILGVYAIYFHLFRLWMPEHLLDTLLITWLYIISLSLQGMMAGLLLKSPLQVVQFLIILILPAWISSGYSWPFDQDALPAQIYGIIFPYMPFINGFRTLLIESWNSV